MYPQALTTFASYLGKKALENNFGREKYTSATPTQVQRTVISGQKSPTTTTQVMGNQAATSPARQQYVQSLAQSTKPTQVASATVDDLEKTYTTPSGATGTLSQLGSMKPTRPSASDSYQKYIRQIAETYKPTGEERDLTKRLDALQGGYEQGSYNIGQQTIPMQFITGQQAALKQQNTIQQLPLQRELERLQADRLGQQQAFTKQAELTAPLIQDPAEGFTLGKDQVRYDAQGNVIAGNAGIAGTAGTGNYEAPIVKSINGVDMQWNTQTGQWDALAQPGVSDYSIERATRTIASVDNLIAKAQASPKIFGRSAAAPIPDWARSDEYRNYSSELKTLASNIAFNELTAMREASKTGGALGQVSDREGQLLQSALGALDMTQSPENIVAQLQQIKDSVNRWQQAVAQYGGSNTTQQPIQTWTAPDGKQFKQNTDGSWEEVSFRNVGGDTNTATIANAIAQVESGGKYTAVGPVTENGDRAYGKYQIMDFNIPAWSQEALGRSVTVQEFLNSPQIQDAVANYKIGQLYARYGNPDDVASVWFSGRPLSGNTSKDVTGTSVPTYVQNVRKYLYA